MEDNLDLDFDEELPVLKTTKVAKESNAEKISSDSSLTEGKTSAERQAERFGIKPVKRIEVGRVELDDLYEDLRVDVQSSRHSTRSVLVKGVDGMSKFAVEKIFAAFHPYRVELVDDVTALVNFSTKSEAGAMFIHMTKCLRRVRCQKKADEEGEVVSSDDEDGQLKNERGDEVAVVTQKGANPRLNKKNVVEVDVDTINIPDGRWRVVTEHVPEQRLLLARFATTQEIMDHRKNRTTAVADMTSAERKRGIVEESTPDGYSYKWSTDEKVRPGLNIFDKEGNELDWDYEHDTRFYEESPKVEPTSDVASTKEVAGEEEEGKGAPQARKVRGRGAKKGRFLYGGGATLSSDTVEDSKAVGKPPSPEDSRDSEDETELEPNLDPAPTPQPWDRRSRLANRVTRAEW